MDYGALLYEVTCSPIAQSVGRILVLFSTFYNDNMFLGSRY